MDAAGEDTCLRIERQHVVILERTEKAGYQVVALNSLVSLYYFSDTDGTDGDPAFCESIGSSIGDNCTIYRPAQFRENIRINKRFAHDSRPEVFTVPHGRP